MKVKFYGTRGSVPVCEPEFQEFGGNTTCVQFTLNDGNIGIFDAGTGIRNLGKDLAPDEHTCGRELLIAFSHFHWDHIQGFPFFRPAYRPDFNITISAIGKERQALDLETIFKTQMQEAYFPIPFEKMGAKFLFHKLDRDSFTSEFAKISTIRHNHPGGAHTYRVDHEGESLVYCTDIEHGQTIDERIVQFAQGAGLLIHDAQYTPDELLRKRGWDHSSWEQAVEVAQRAEVRRLALTHHDPNHSDTFLKDVEQQCQEHFPNSFFAREKMEIDL